MAKRISDIAKELGIPSKVIIQKCLDEGIPTDQVKGHMSVVKAGLEASIREWFSTSAVATAVETSEHVNIEKVRAKPRSKAKAKSTDEHANGADTGAVAVVDAPAAPPQAGRQSSTPTEFAEPTERHPAARRKTEAPAPAVPSSPHSPQLAPTPSAIPAAEPSEAPLTPTLPPPGPALAKAPAIPPTSKQTPPPPPPATITPPPTAPAPVTPAPMNVPTRPKVVQPVGQKLQVKPHVKIGGPTVVRIEKAEVIEAPRPRRVPGAGGPMGPRGGGAGAGPAPEAGGDDRGQRRNKRRATGPGAAPAADRGVPARRRGKSDGAAEELGTGMFSEQDLIEREARLQRSGGFLKKRRHELKARAPGSPHDRAVSAAESGGKVMIREPITIKDLSAATGVKVSDILKALFMQGVMATANSGIDSEKAQEIMMDHDIELVVQQERTAEDVVSETFGKREAADIRARGPIVTILGHVDHGKTSLLDRIRNANVAAGEAGGITQATSAFRVPLKIGDESKHIVFLDTPGHEAFTSMRARGAAITDIVVLVVSAPEGVMPQTIESINHAKAAKVPIVVALNKIDRQDATDAKINQTIARLAEEGLNPVEWGGTTEFVRTSATTGQGIDKLLEILDLQGQVLELKADAKGHARGTVVESRTVEGRGATANIIIQDGELKIGDYLVAGRAFGRVRDIVDDRGERLKSAGPTMPVQISGLDEIPDAGDKFFVVDSQRQAQDAAEQRRARERQLQLAQPKVTLDSLFSQMKDASTKEILIVLKADVKGSVDVLKPEIEKVSTDEVKIRVLHAAVGGITESDVLLADASRAVIIGFNVIPSGKARQLAETKNVEIRTYQVIYEITDDVKKAASGMLEPEIRQEILGHAEVRRVFKLSKVGAVAGCYVTNGVIERNAFIRVTRQGVVIENGRVLEQLKRVKDDAKEVRAGNECGMKIAGYDDIKEGDILECYKQVKVKRTL